MTNGNESAYPFAETVKSEHRDILGNPQVNFHTEMTGGLTKREHFAAMALQAVDVQAHVASPAAKNIAASAVNIADALIDALNQEAK